MQGRGEDIVKIVQVFGGQQGLAVKQAGVLRPFLQSAGLHRAQKHAGINLPIEALTDGMTAGRQVNGRAHRTHRLDDGSGRVATFLGPAQQRIAAQGHAHCIAFSWVK